MARVKGSIRSFTSKGGSYRSYTGSSSGIVIGVRDPATGRIIRGPRPELDSGVKAQAHVKVVNPAALGSRKVRMNASLGMGGVGQVARN